MLDPGCPAIPQNPERQVGWRAAVQPQNAEIGIGPFRLSRTCRWRGPRFEPFEEQAAFANGYEFTGEQGDSKSPNRPDG
jgi:hypothetical protein